MLFLHFPAGKRLNERKAARLLRILVHFYVYIAGFSRYLFAQAKYILLGYFLHAFFRLKGYVNSNSLLGQQFIDLGFLHL